MKTIRIRGDDVVEGQQVTVWFGSSGQGGTAHWMDDDGITILAPYGRRFTWTWDEVTSITTEVAHDPEECLQYGPDCKGPVDLHWTGGQRSWPRCDHHAEERHKSYENSLERYADSDVVPDWFDPANAGERWDDDY